MGSASVQTTRSGGLSRIELWTEKWSDRFNPLLVREVRQLLRSRQFLLVFLGLLTSAWLASTASVLWHQDMSSLFSDAGLRGVSSGATLDGRPLFGALSLLLAAALFLPVPMTAFHSFTDEFRDAALEMLQVSGLSSRDIVWGKLSGAVLQGGIYLSAVAPFLSLTYLLQGVGILSILGMLLLLMGTCFALCAAGLAAGSMARSPFLQIFCALGVLVLSAFSFCEVLLVLDAFTSAQQSLPIFICITIPVISLTMISLSIAHSQVRPLQNLVIRVDFIDLNRLSSISVKMRDWLEMNRSLDLLLAVDARKSDASHIAALAEANLRGGAEAASLDRIMNSSRDFFLRFNFVTHQEVNELLLSLRKLFDELVFSRRWIRGEKGVPVIGAPSQISRSLPPQPALLQTLEKTLGEFDAKLAIAIAAEQAEALLAFTAH